MAVTMCSSEAYHCKNERPTPGYIPKLHAPDHKHYKNMECSLTNLLLQIKISLAQNLLLVFAAWCLLGIYTLGRNPAFMGRCTVSSQVS